MLKWFQHFYNSEVCSTFTLISALSCCAEVPPVLPTPLPGRGLLQVLHVEAAGLLLGVPASRALPRLTEASKVPGTGGVVSRVTSGAAIQADTPVTYQGLASTVHLRDDRWDQFTMITIYNTIIICLII